MVKKSHLKPPSRGLARTVYTAENFKLHILFLQGCKNSKAFGSNWQIVLRLVCTQAKESNIKITGKNVANFSDPWAACKTWSSNEFFSAAVLKQKEKRPQLKIQTPKRVRYLWYYLIRILQSPTGPAEGVGDFSKFKKETV